MLPPPSLNLQAAVSTVRSAAAAAEAGVRATYEMIIAAVSARYVGVIRADCIFECQRYFMLCGCLIMAHSESSMLHAFPLAGVMSCGYPSQRQLRVSVWGAQVYYERTRMYV